MVGELWHVARCSMGRALEEALRNSAARQRHGAARELVFDTRSRRWPLPEPTTRYLLGGPNGCHPGGMRKAYALSCARRLRSRSAGPVAGSEVGFDAREGERDAGVSSAAQSGMRIEPGATRDRKADATAPWTPGNCGLSTTLETRP